MLFFLTATMSDRKAVIKNADMSEEMQQDAVDCATQALEKYNIEKDIAAYIKKEFDKKYNPTWHCIVGRNFGSYVTHETRWVVQDRLEEYLYLTLYSGISSTSTWDKWQSSSSRVDKLTEASLASVPALGSNQPKGVVSKFQ